MLFVSSMFAERVVSTLYLDGDILHATLPPEIETLRPIAVDCECFCSFHKFIITFSLYGSEVEIVGSVKLLTLSEVVLLVLRPLKCLYLK